MEVHSRSRYFVPIGLTIDGWESVAPLFEALANRGLETMSNLEQWLLDRDELDAALEEELARRYIRMNCDTANPTFQSSFQNFIETIEPPASEFGQALDLKLLASPVLPEMENGRFRIYLRNLKKKTEIFRTENIPLFVEIQTLEQEYGRINGQMTISHEGRDLTLQQGALFLKSPDRVLRREVFEKIQERRLQDAEELDQLFSKLLGLRHQVALNAGFSNYRDYRFADLSRFDYGVSECLQFHETIEKEVVPLIEILHTRRCQAMGLPTLQPYDLEVDQLGRPPLKPFSEPGQLLERSVDVFGKIDPDFGDFLSLMARMGHFDLESRKNKAPGGFQYPLYETNVPFIFMNAAGHFRDMVTLMHEGGHAVHSWLSNSLHFCSLRSCPSEVAELASMSMELISIPNWGVFFPDPAELDRAITTQLEGVLSVLPWIAVIDAFQHFLYTHPGHSPDERRLEWLRTLDRFSPKGVDWSLYTESRAFQWQKQLHLYEVPFYYIEYAFAQLGAIALWRNYTLDPESGLADYRKALALGNTATIPEIYQTAGIRFDFSPGYVRELMNFLREKLAL